MLLKRSVRVPVELVSCPVTLSARAYGSEGRSEARRQPTDQYDAALDTTEDHERVQMAVNRPSAINIISGLPATP
jgi:hypothetical protein